MSLDHDPSQLPLTGIVSSRIVGNDKDGLPPTPAAELVNYFLRFSLTMDEAFSYFIDHRFFSLPQLDDPCYAPSISHEWLSEIIDAFVIAATSGKLNSVTREEVLEYLHQDKTLFAVCAILVMKCKHETFYCLTLIRPKDPAWSQCFRKIQQIEVLNMPKREFHLQLEDFLDFLIGGGDVKALGRGPFRGTESTPSQAHALVEDDSAFGASKRVANALSMS
ncbi:uncharacterized protein BT62DRAFT_1002332 [Guyanagaster necrorhizus]|uniref:Uncharacterized protein n=1 Tax=Guyanagaster necrorhizus TaxID=856835 RepID=A0A9P8AW54_9AGAR|nr:uncharacterized protein BT62DRAFT_1002332 [Guyanagaster necrorhizus MCA 3950]KAG7450005.1 hypothetical protein BT62DRAFT_1002332 [Guyanagaster necrorhizus MCA 3950]